MSVYTGGCDSELTCLVGDGGWFGCVILSFNSTPDETYYILVDGYGGETGAFELTATGEVAPTPPVNDNCGDAELLTVFPTGSGTATSGNNTNATSFNGFYPCYGPNNNISDVWYAFDSGPNVQVEVNISSTSDYFTFAVYEHCGGSKLGNCKYGGQTIDVKPATEYKLQLFTIVGSDGEFTILLNDGPNTEAQFSSPTTVSLSRYSGDRHVVPTATAIDNEGQEQNYSITGGNGAGIFSIDATTANITVVNGAALANSLTTQYILTVQAADQGPGSLTATGTITINIFDNRYPVVSNQEADLDENTANNSDVLNVNANDPDNGAVLSYRIIGGNTGSAFMIDNTGLIKVADDTKLDFETTPVFELEVEITDNGSPSLKSTATITIHLKDVNEAPVVANATYDISKYNSNGDPVGLVEITDQDSEQTHTFAITAGNTNTIFRIDNQTGEIVFANATLLETTSGPYTLTVRVTDNEIPPLSGSATITIHVVDNNPPVITSSTAFSVDENTPGGTIIWTMTATDVDDDEITFSMAGGNELGGFSITSAGEIQVADVAVLDFETNQVFNLEIKAQDNGSGLLAGFQTIRITINDLNEFAPEVNSLVYS